VNIYICIAEMPKVDGRMDLAVKACQENPSLSVDQGLIEGGFIFEEVTGDVNFSSKNVEGKSPSNVNALVEKKKKKLELIRRLRKLGCTNPGVTTNTGRRGRPAGSKDTAPRKARRCPKCGLQDCPNSKPGPRSRYTCVAEDKASNVKLENV
jgi:hypothetical protein